MGTDASAQGNAAALLNVIESSPPDTCPFDMVLTEEMELLHFINNEDVMEHAEEIDDLEARNISSAARWARMNSRQRMRNGGIPHSIDQRNARIVELEELILAEIAEAQNEYGMLAHALCENREDYVEARARVGNAPISQGTQRRMNRTGRDNSRPDLSRSDMHEILSFERIHDSYKLLESGFAHVTTQEQLSRILTVIGREILIEIVTVGLAKYVRVVRAGLRALDEAASAIARGAGQVVVSRYQRLSPATRQRLGNLYQRRQPDRPVEHPRDGQTVEGTPASSQLDETCTIGGAVCSFG